MSHVINIEIHTYTSSHKPFLKSQNKQFRFLSAILNLHHYGRETTGTITLAVNKNCKEIMNDSYVHNCDANNSHC